MLMILLMSPWKNTVRATVSSQEGRILGSLE
jgi:hypothetical protein